MSSDKEGKDVFGVEARELAEFMEGDEGALFFLELPADAREQFPGGAFPATGDVHDVFDIDNNTVGDFTHKVRFKFFAQQNFFFLPTACS
jgi:hypothetical protein